MTVRLRLALTVLLTGLATAFGVLVTVALAFERFEREAAYARADAFLGRVVALHADLPAQQRRDPEGFTVFLKSLLLFEPDNQLYLLAPDGTVLASTGSKTLPPEFKVAIAPVRQAATAAVQAPQRSAAYVMGDDPEYMDEGAVIAARELRQPAIRPGADFAGYLYIVCRKPGLPPSRVARLAAHLAGPALGPVLAVVLLATLLAAWIIAAVTRPLAVLSDEVARAARAGFGAETPALPMPGGSMRVKADDEFGRLHAGFQALLTKLHAQWDRLRRLDAFRRESVSNLSHDLRSPLTAAAASLETLQQRWRTAAPADPAGAERAEDARLVDVALRNTHNAARLVRSLGDLAVLDEDSFRLRLARLDLGEMLDDIAMRFAERAARQGVAIRCEFGGELPGDDAGGGDARVSAGAGRAGSEGSAGSAGSEGGELVAEVDVELIERAIANLLDNALRFTPAGGGIVLCARALREPAAGARSVRLAVRDSGSGIAPADLEHLFDRHFRGRAGHAARAEGGPTGNGLGLAIVQRIVELHGGQVAVHSESGQGTTVQLDLPARPPLADEGHGPTAAAARHGTE
ncbi:MAG: HAMP domain-containing histidine kinase [Burkholderiales bacterium]|nr:HAMP domain-containing histidine kinase [Burkholderiales bacterium]